MEGASVAGMSVSVSRRGSMGERGPDGIIEARDCGLGRKLSMPVLLRCSRGAWEVFFRGPHFTMGCPRIS